jgi:hypothetical protein
VLDRSAHAAAVAHTFPGVLSVNVLPAGFRRGQSAPNGNGAPPAPALALQHDPSALIPPPPPPGFAEAATQPGPATVHVRVNGDDALLSAMLARMVAEGVPVFGFEETVGDLEEIFLATTKGLVQ